MLACCALLPNMQCLYYGSFTAPNTPLAKDRQPLGHTAHHSLWPLRGFMLSKPASFAESCQYLVVLWHQSSLASSSRDLSSIDMNTPGPGQAGHTNKDILQCGFPWRITLSCSAPLWPDAKLAPSPPRDLAKATQHTWHMDHN